MKFPLFVFQAGQAMAGVEYHLVAILQPVARLAIGERNGACQQDLRETGAGAALWASGGAVAQRASGQQVAAIAAVVGHHLRAGPVEMHEIRVSQHGRRGTLDPQTGRGNQRLHADAQRFLIRMGRSGAQPWAEAATMVGRACARSASATSRPLPKPTWRGPLLDALLP